MLEVVMSISVIKGNIWNTKCGVLVNTVNCQGVMGAGMALEAKLRYPEMYQKYREFCQKGLLEVGKLDLYKKSEPYWILNFPTKNQWKLPSREEYIVLGLQKFVNSYQEKNINSIAFPILGGMNGKLNEDRVLDIMTDFLVDLPIDIEIYQYDPMSNDDFFEEFKKILLSTDVYTLSKSTKIRQNYLEILIDEITNNPNYRQVNQLVKIKGIGDTTLEKIFQYQKLLTKNQQTELF